ncbi:5-methyltetrahydropteroyltriglutamate--homocysteine S-methyltransferase [Acidomonas methanolica]|uniref:5-methyltetrahydropteroyltriglutamate--homocysteine methyltransferase n=2 Tax=Acidomonas methanolica TaxID=437 RepID=A0A023D815_ACIMT|nr:5-methyltetrahydropteroyltriglutamate--homocysteine S-methyltransferase [Acidomonas methanolica]MBU2654226.1 5-methyltetrahydropteroyltriglutamate--homocysteine S-methyltransferase [Acidomonas methanolica]TCS29342.1 methionine synthase (B12-independent) [Acidomonas methanolica]GAJ30258.1 5-methyltetrahydropteroyltriglutamate--homocysteine S-methyltransferase [Acidomonas methanolica NBRC 104435]GEK99415.1 5-methyltetrahydropteroyltriglutamate--homocysteine methyltransferase [Acidomonas methan
MGVSVATLGFPRIGPRRELKTALESYWSGKAPRQTLLDTAAALRAENWKRQQEGGADIVPSNDFSLYDHVLDNSALFGVVPEAYGWDGGTVGLDTYFAMARGAAGVTAGEMTKWFDTNYHYLVPEFSAGQAFRLASTKIVDEFLEAKAQGLVTRPVLLGPVTYLLLGKARDGADPLTLLPKLLPAYAEVLGRLADAGAEWVQIDEPALVLDLTAEARAAFGAAYTHLTRAAPSLKLMLATYFGALGDNLATALALPVQGLHVDLARAPEQLAAVVAGARPDLLLSLGVIDGRNIWRADLSALLDRLEPVVKARGNVVIAPSCSLIHVPIDLARETDLDPDVASWLAFAVQKIEELRILALALNEGRDAATEALAASDRARDARRISPKIHDPAVRDRLATQGEHDSRRASPFGTRREAQRAALGLPAWPTTTIGSFPQTPEVRRARADHAKGALSDESYTAFLREETARAVRWQEEVGLDALVHGEFERNDMVQYFGEQLAGFVFTKHGWVQSYGSRYVRPPIIFGDVSRPAAMTVEWWRYAQSLTERPLKGMLTGPVTILNWSFVRDDQPRSVTCRQIAFAIRDEVLDLEKAGARMIQIDEAALREGLPLRRAEWRNYLDWAVESFRIAASGVADATQIHTHMCYSEFNDIIAAIGAMDADVISIETARSRMELLDAFAEYAYPAEIGPGVYDIHSPRVPDVEEMVALLRAARKRLDDDQIWVNPDCGLKTRKWEEVRPAIVNMVSAARMLRG